MKPRFFSRSLLAAASAATVAFSPFQASAVALTWDGGGADDNWSTLGNWSDGVGDPALAPATGDTLTFAGNDRLTPNNDLSTLVLGNVASATAFTFASGAGSFNVQGNALTVGTSTANTVLADLISSSNQWISNNITLAGGQRDRNIRFGTGAGSLTLSGNIHFGNDIIGMSVTTSTGVAGTLTLSGNNTGDGKGAQISSGGNQLRAMLWTPQDNSRLIIGSNSALGNASTGDPTLGTNTLRGIISSRVLYLSTTGGDRNLSNYAVGISGGRLEFDGADNLSLGTVITHNGNRDLWVTGNGKLTVTGNIFLSNNDTGRNLFFNVTGSGGAEVSGKIRDSFSNTTGSFITMLGQGTLRKAGAGLLTLSGDNPYTGLTQIEGGTLRLGHPNALGSSASTDYTSLRAATLDLNGQSTAETFFVDNSAAKITNSSVSAAAVTTDMRLSGGNLTIEGSGDISLARVWHTVVRTMSKDGTGALTVAGTGSNNLIAWTINQGTVVFANTTGLASDRGTTLNGGTLRLSGVNSNLINDSQAFTINSGTFDLNGKGEAVASIDGSGGTITNGNASAATLYVGGGVGGSSTATYAGTIQDGTGILNLHKEGTGTQTLTGTLTYSGNTTVSQTGTLSINSASLNDASTVTIGADAFLNLPFSGTDTIASLVIDGVTQANGEYGATGSGAANETNRIIGSGRIQVGSVPSYSYATWQSVNASGQGISQDHDGDDVPNGIEYFMGLNGSAFTTNPGPVAGSVTWPMDTEYSGAYGTGFLVQSSENLVDWTLVPEGTGDGTVTVTPGVSVVYDMPTSGKRFIRLVVNN